MPDLFTVQLIFFTIIFSLFFQNAMRAVVEQHGSSVDIPPLKVLITKGRQDLTVKVCSLTDNSACSKTVASQFLATSLRFFLRCFPILEQTSNSCFAVLNNISSDALFFSPSLFYIFLITQTCSH